MNLWRILVDKCNLINYLHHKIYCSQREFACLMIARNYAVKSENIMRNTLEKIEIRCKL
jgi:hypothetical protein